MPPSSSPMITSTIAISTSVKPCPLFFIANLPWTVQAIAYLQHPCHAKMGQKSRLDINLRGDGVEFPTTASVLRHFLSFRPASDTRLQLVEPLLEEPGLGRIADGPFCEQPADHDLRRLQLAPVPAADEHQHTAALGNATLLDLSPLVAPRSVAYPSIHIISMSTSQQ